LRNNVWCVFADTGNKVSGVPDDPSAPRELRHGHSAIIAPDGRIVAATQHDTETIVVADVDISLATRVEAKARANNPVLGLFWQAGIKLQSNQTELAELAAMAGAQIHVHLDHDPTSDPDASLRRLQVWSNLASFQTFTATVNVVGSAIWDDLHDAEQRAKRKNFSPHPPRSGGRQVIIPAKAPESSDRARSWRVVHRLKHHGPIRATSCTADH